MNQTADLTEKTLSREEKYQGSFLSLHVDQVQLPNGRTSFREVVEHVDGVAILALDDRNNVLTVTQYRYVIGKTLLEIPAGKLEPGEDPVAGALRELKEETGAVPDTFLPMGVTLPSPGCLSERLYLFLAKGLHMESQQLDEDEFLNVERIPFNEMVHRVMDGEIEDSKTIAAVLKAKVLLNLLQRRLCHERSENRPDRGGREEYRGHPAVQSPAGGLSDAGGL